MGYITIPPSCIHTQIFKDPPPSESCRPLKITKSREKQRRALRAKWDAQGT